MMMVTATMNDARQRQGGGSKIAPLYSAFCFDRYNHYFGAYADTLLSSSFTFYLSLSFSLVPVKCFLCSYLHSNLSPPASWIASMTWPLVSHDDAADNTADPSDALASTTYGPQQPNHTALDANQGHMGSTPEHGYSLG